MRKKQFTYKGYNIYILADDTSDNKLITVKKNGNVVYKNMLNLKHFSDAIKHGKKIVDRFKK